MFQIVVEDRTKSSLHLQRCQPGKNGKTDQQVAAEGEAGVHTISTKEDEEGVEEGTEGVKYKEAGQMVGIRAIIKMEEEEGTMEATMGVNKAKEDQGILEEDIKGTKVEGGIKGKGTKVEGDIMGKDTKVEGVIKVKDIKVEGIKGVTKGRDTLVEVTKGDTMDKMVVTKVTTKMEGDSRNGEGVEGVVEVEDEEDEVGKVEAGVEEGGRILTREGNLSSFSNMEGISITRRGLGRGFTPAKLSIDQQMRT